MSKQQKTKRQLIITRYLLITSVMLAAAGYIAFCLFKNTVLYAAKWNDKAKIELSRSETIIQPERGDILAADGTVLATTLQFYTLRMDFRSDNFRFREYVEAIDSLADSLQVHFPIAGGVKAWQDSLSAPLRRAKRPRSWRLIQNVTYADFQLIKTFPFFARFKAKASATGLTSEPLRRRRNPYGSMAKLSIGVVSENRRTGEVHGMSGLEYALDSLLYGRRGTNKVVNFTRGVGGWADTAAVRGYDVVSTIDIEMQDVLENSLLTRLQECRAEWGTGVLMEVATGEIKGICNLEEYPLGSGSGHYVEAMNRAVMGFEPGSVVKTLSMMIAVEDGLVRDTAQVIPIGASFRAYGQGRPITDSHFNAQLTVAGVIEQSSNIGMARIITPHYHSPQAWHDRVAALGFLEKLHSGIGEEQAPRYPVVPFDRGGLVTLSRQTYGYACEIPPLHTLSIYNAIANGGKYVRPRLVKALRRDGVDSIIPVSYVRDQVCSPKTAQIMQGMLRRVVNGSRGTARSLKNPYVILAGKTGTCYSVNPATGTYDTGRKRLAFCGYFPAGEGQTPLYSCVVLIYHPRENFMGAASTSGVVLKNVALGMYSRGMLDNTSDFRAGADTLTKAPAVYASTTPATAKALQKAFGVNARPMRNGTAKTADGVPSVLGMGLREAVKTLESAGYNVSYRGGRGYVSSQSLTDKGRVLISFSE
jgi:cell division protein FtsI (penicillin-binding protein 3)